MSVAGDVPVFVGETFAQRTRFTDAGIRAFALSVDDHNPLHHDREAAQGQGYRAIIASGTQLGSVLMAMTATNFARPDGQGRPRSGLGMGFELRFRAPVYAEEDIDLRWTITSVERKDKLDGWIVQLEGDARSGETVLIAATGTLLIRRPKPGWPGV